ncbi:MAG: hypothetical protein AAF617_13710, partial [Bacteroidota bacterium]
MKHILTMSMFLLCIGNIQSVFAQSKEKILQEHEKKIEAYINAKIDVPLSKVELLQFIHRFNHSEHGGRFEDLSKETQDAYIKAHKIGKLWHGYFEQYPETRALYKSRPAPLCENGGFEYGNFNVYEGASASGAGGGYKFDECEAIPVNGVGNYNWIPDNLTNPNVDHFKIVSPGNDPIVAAGGGQLNRVHSGNYAARVNSPSKFVNPTITFTNFCYPNFGINRLIKNITLQQDGVQEISFYYALVSEFPDHDNQNPVFIARALNANQAEFDRFCIISNPNNNPFFNRFTPAPNECSSNPRDILWKDWDCATLEVSGKAGDVITLEFIVTDCGQGAHYGYAYIDDICVPCDGDGTNDEGSIDLDELNPCQEPPFDVCGTFALPQLNGQVGTVNNITLDILQNGLVVNTLTNPTITGNTFCFTVNDTDFPSQSGGYDFRVNAQFSIANGIQQVTETNTTPGTNNDFIFDNPECCKIEANATNISCDDNGTPNDPSDDTWSFDLIVGSDTNTGNWIAPSILTQSVPYGTTVNVPMGNIANYGATVAIVITDKEDDTCTTTITVPVPETCSDNECTLEAVTSVGSCNDNGTPNDPSDDYYNITLDVFNTNGEPWMVLNSNMMVIYFGNGDENNVNLGNNFLVSNQLEWFWVKLNNDPNCFVDVTVLAPESCDFTCNISTNITTSDCHDNGTQEDPSDDYYYITVDVLGTNGISWDLVGYPNYQQIAYSGTGNVTNLQLGPISASDPSWVLYITPTGLVNPTCVRYETTVFAPKCSEKDPRGKVVITPNPNKGKMDILVDTRNDSFVQLNIHRIDGSVVRTIKKEKASYQALQFDLSVDLPKGLYLFN